MADAPLGRALARFPAGTRFAVRSSGADEDGAGHSFAGVHDTLLEVPAEGVAAAVATCFASMVSDRARTYRAALDREAVAGGAVLLQPMIRARAAGVAFTEDPISGSRDVVVINAAPGPGGAMVSGQVEPDEYRLRKADGVELSRTLTHPTPALSVPQVAELAVLLQRIERLFGSPQDVEWVHDGSTFWIVQSRPVSGVPWHGPATEWTRANLREVLPDLPSPQALHWAMHMCETGMRNCWGPLLAPAEDLGPMAASFFGRPYFNLSQFRHLCQMSGTPPRMFLEGLGHAGDVTEGDDRFGLPALRVLPPLLRMIRVAVFPEATLRPILAEGMAMLRRLQADPSQLDDAAVWDALHAFNAGGPRMLEMALALGGAVHYLLWLRLICNFVGVPADVFLNTQLAALPKTVSAQQGLDLLDVAREAHGEAKARAWLAGEAAPLDAWRTQLAGTRTLERLEAFLATYGHRGSYETDYAIPRLREDPGPLLFAVRSHVRAGDCRGAEAIHARQAAAAAASWRAFTDRLRGPWRLLLPPVVRFLLGRAQRMYRLREGNRFDMVRVVSEARRWHLELARRFVARGWIAEADDYFFLLVEEVAATLRHETFAARAAGLVARRKAERTAWSRLEMPLHVWGSEIPELAAGPRSAGAAALSHKEVLRGMCVSPGRIEAEVAVLRDPSEFARMRPGAILVTAATDPSWTPLFTLASGVITEIGGTLSHASTVARELSLPALANVRNATRVLVDGERVRLDATHGRVERL